jgi:anti-anti-sigma factor
MERPYRHIDVEPAGDVFYARLRQSRMDENALYEMGDELTRLVREDGCRKLILSLGPEEPECLYSVFLAKLVGLRRDLLAAGGGLKLCHVKPETLRIFDVCRLTPLFDFYPDKAAALAAFSS